MSALQPIIKKASDLISDKQFADNYETGIVHLIKSGVINFLRSYARPVISDNGKDIYASAAQAQFCAGYHQALEDVEFFVQIYGQKTVNQSNNLKMDFGGIRRAVEQGNITAEEALTMKGKI